MTRINCVPVSELSRQHLVAEYREITRVLTLIEASEARGERPDDPRNPREYTLGTGHVRFFYDKAAWVLDRQQAIYSEMKRRGYSPQHKPGFDRLYALPHSRRKWWLPNDRDMRINRERIAERSET